MSTLLNLAIAAYLLAELQRLIVRIVVNPSKSCDLLALESILRIAGGRA